MKKLILLIILLVTVCININLDTSHASVNNYFTTNNLTGTLIISSLNTDQRYVYNPERARKRFLPASTFKIINTLIALEEKVIADENEIIKWDGSDKGVSEWNKDQNLKSAFASSCVWFYQELAKKIGLEKYQQYLEKLQYGNQKTGTKTTTFWLDGDLRISAEEQIDVLKKIYRRQYSFKTENYNILNKIMIVKSNPDYVVRAKTGWARTSPQIGWYVGYVETKNDIWFFACNIDIHYSSQSRHRQEAVYAGLRDLKIMK